MIGEALQATLTLIIPNTFSEIADENTAAPFCIHSENETEIRHKEGIAGYAVEVEIAIVDVTPDLVKSKSISIINAINALQGTTTNSTKIDSVDYEGDASGFDQESKQYLNVLKFSIETINR